MLQGSLVQTLSPPSQKMAVFYTFVNRASNTGSDPTSFNSEIQYLKPIALDRGYDSSIVDKALFKLQNPRIFYPSHSNFIMILPFFPFLKFLNSMILK